MDLNDGATAGAQPEPTGPTHPDASLGAQMEAKKREIYDGAVQSFATSVESFVRRAVAAAPVRPHDQGPEDGFVTMSTEPHIEAITGKGRTAVVQQSPTEDSQSWARLAISARSNPDNTVERLMTGELQIRLDAFAKTESRTPFDTVVSHASHHALYTFRQEGDQRRVETSSHLELKLDAQATPPDLSAALNILIAKKSQGRDTTRGSWIVSMRQTRDVSVEELYALTHEMAQTTTRLMALDDDFDVIPGDRTPDDQPPLRSHLVMEDGDVAINVEFSAPKYWKHAPEKRATHPAHEVVANHVLPRDQLGPLAQLVDGSDTLNKVLKAARDDEVTRYLGRR